MRSSAIDLSLDPSTQTYRPVPFWDTWRHLGDPNRRRFVVGWLIASLLFIPTGMLTRVLEWTGVPVTLGGMELYLTLYLPLLYCTVCVLWFGYAWGAIPAYISTFCVALLGGMPLQWILLFSFANPVGLAVYVLAYRALPIRTDLRTIASVVFFVVVAFVAALLGSSGSFIWAYTSQVTGVEVMPVWQGWWLGGFLQTVLINGAILLVASPAVIRWKVRQELGLAPNRAQARRWLLMAFVVLVLALTAYIFLVRHFSLLKLDETIAVLDAPMRQAIYDAIEGLSLIHWVTLLLLAATGLFGYQMVLNWTASLRASTRELTRLNRKLTSEIDERRRIEVQLQEKSHKLEEVNHSKDRFFSIISHDLRSPLGSILTLARTLNEDFDEIDPPLMREFLQLLHGSSESLYELLENLLAWARLQTDGMVHRPEAFDLALLVRDVAGLLSNHASDKQLFLHLNIEEGSLVWADTNMMRSVLQNLISNAIKFTRPGGAVIVNATPAGPRLYVEVRDTGIGMDEAQRERLFRVEDMVTTRGTANERGSGLGLILCKEMVERHGSTLSVASQPGVGTTFSFTLPLHTPEAAPPEERRRDESVRTP